MMDISGHIYLLNYQHIVIQELQNNFRSIFLFDYLHKTHLDKMLNIFDLIIYHTVMELQGKFEHTFLCLGPHSN